MYWLRLLTVMLVGAFLVLLALASIFVPLALAVWYGDPAWLGTYLGSLILIGFVYIAGESLEDWLNG